MCVKRMRLKVKGREIMATQVYPTPIISGKMAKKILRESKEKPSKKSIEGAKKIIDLFEKK